MISLGAGSPSNRLRRQLYGGYNAAGLQPPTTSEPPSLLQQFPIGIAVHSIGQPPHFSAGGGDSTPFHPSAECLCKEENKCPHGPVGPPGDIGLSGKPGSKVDRLNLYFIFNFLIFRVYLGFLVLMQWILKMPVSRDALYV
jgi:hypothetical protein